MGFVKCFARWTARLAVCSVLISVLIVTIPGIPPHYNFESFKITPPKKAVGWSATNLVLDKAEIYFDGEHSGPESVAIRGDEIFTGDWAGNIIKIKDGKATVVAKLEFPCELDQLDGPRCSKPLGLRFDKTGHLILTDIHGGLIKVNVDNGKYENLMPKWVPINGKTPWVPEDLDISKDGIIFWSDGSTVEMTTTEFFAQPSGRLMKYDPITKINTVLLEELHFSNGVCLAANEDFVLVAETGSSQIRRYYLKGKKSGQSDIFIDGLPGYPDNIRSNGKGGFYVALWAPWDDNFSMNFHILSEYPLIRKLMLRSRYFVQRALKGLKLTLPPNVYIDFATEYVDLMMPLSNFHNIPKTAKIAELSNTGEIIGVLNGKNGNCHILSSITVGKTYAYLTSPMDTKVWRIKLQDLYSKGN